MFKWLRSLFAADDAQQARMSKAVRDLEAAAERCRQSRICAEKIGVIMDGLIRRLDGEPWESVKADVDRRIAAVK